MRPLGNLAIVGSGATAIYLLHHIAKQAASLAGALHSITVLERTSLAGCGMPYHPETTDIHNMSNISSEEIPELPETFYDWLLDQDAEDLRGWQIDPDNLSESEVYPRLPLGAYLNAQYNAILGQLRAAGIPVEEKTLCDVSDIIPRNPGECLEIATGNGTRMKFDTVVIATGHAWWEDDDPENGYYGSPWPISKILPGKGDFHNIPIGTLGASLSAFDVVSSLSHRHGDFRKTEDGLSYHPYPGTDGFRITMHAANGWLPHLQFAQVEPFRVIYRHVTRERMLDLRDTGGRLRIHAFFDGICRPALLEAFAKDGLADVAARLRDPDFTLEDFVRLMEDKHEFGDGFTVMRAELPEARASVVKHKPIHWKEVMDDLMFTLNFHAELMPAEDHLVLRKTVMPFLMSVIAAMPLSSAEMLLALHDAGKLELVPGKVSIEEGDRSSGTTTITVTDGDDTKKIKYDMFIDCSGQKPIDLDEYPFRSLVTSGRLRRARAAFVSQHAAERARDGEQDEHIFRNGADLLLHTGGIDIDAAYRIVAEDGTTDSRVFDLAFPHTSGVRPYSYGLQASEATAGIVVASWTEALREGSRIKGSLEETTERYVESRQ